MEANYFQILSVTCSKAVILIWKQTKRGEKKNNIIGTGVVKRLKRYTVKFNFSATCSCESRQPDTSSSGWKSLMFVWFETKDLQILMLIHTFHSE